MKFWKFCTVMRDGHEARREINELKTEVTSLAEAISQMKNQVETRTDERPGVRESISGWVGLGVAILSLVIAGATFFFSFRELNSLELQADTARAQTTAQQRTSDWELVGGVSVSLDGSNFVIENRSSSAIMSTATWLVGDTDAQRSFDALFFELGGVPGCSRVSTPIVEITQQVQPLDELEWVESKDNWDWPPFVTAYTYIVAPSGGLYSTSTLGGFIDHGVVGPVDQSSVDYGDRADEDILGWGDPTKLAWVPDTFWEFGQVQVAEASAPLWAGAPVMGTTSNSTIVAIDCK